MVEKNTGTSRISDNFSQRSQLPERCGAELGWLLWWDLWIFDSDIFRVGVHGLPRLSINSWPPPLHADQGGGNSQAPSGLQSQKCCLLRPSAQNWQTSLLWTICNARDSCPTPGSEAHMCEMTPTTRGRVMVFWDVSLDGASGFYPSLLAFWGVVCDRVEENF